MFKQLLLITHLISSITLNSIQQHHFKNTTLETYSTINEAGFAEPNEVPNSGYISNVYVNKYKSTADVVELLMNVDSQLDYVDNPLLPHPDPTNSIYVVYCSTDLSKVLYIERSLISGGINNYYIRSFNFQTMTSDLLFHSNDTFILNDSLIYPGWQMSTPVITINNNLVSSVPDFNIPVGQQNSLLNQLISTDNLFVDIYSYDDGYEKGYEEGDENGYQNGYEFGLLTGQQNGEEIGYQNGYIDGQRYGEQLGYNVGHEAGYDEGYNEGYNVGFEEGKVAKNPFGGFFEILESATSSMHNFFSIEILPNLTLSTILGIFIALPLFIFFMKLISAK